MQSQSREEVAKLINMKCPLPKILYSITGGLSCFQKKFDDITKKEANVMKITGFPSLRTSCKFPSNSSKTNYNNNSTKIRKNVKLNNINNNNNIINNQQKKNENKNYLVKLLTDYGLLKYLNPIKKLGFNDKNINNIGLMDRNDFDELLANLKVFPGHIIKMEKLYENLKQINLNCTNSNNFNNSNINNTNYIYNFNNKKEGNDDSNNSNNNNKNGVNFVNLSFNYREIYLANNHNNSNNFNINNDKNFTKHNFNYCRNKFIYPITRHKTANFNNNNTNNNLCNNESKKIKIPRVHHSVNEIGEKSGSKIKNKMLSRIEQPYSSPNLNNSSKNNLVKCHSKDTSQFQRLHINDSQGFLNFNESDSMLDRNLNLNIIGNNNSNNNSNINSNNNINSNYNINNSNSNNNYNNNNCNNIKIRNSTKSFNKTQFTKGPSPLYNNSNYNIHNNNNHSNNKGNNNNNDIENTFYGVKSKSLLHSIYNAYKRNNEQISRKREKEKNKEKEKEKNYLYSNKSIDKLRTLDTNCPSLEITNSINNSNNKSKQIIKKPLTNEAPSKPLLQKTQDFLINHYSNKKGLPNIKLPNINLNINNKTNLKGMGISSRKIKENSSEIETNINNNNNSKNSSNTGKERAKLRKRPKNAEKDLKGNLNKNSIVENIGLRSSNSNCSNNSNINSNDNFNGSKNEKIAVLKSAEERSSKNFENLNKNLGLPVGGNYVSSCASRNNNLNKNKNKGNNNIINNNSNSNSYSNTNDGNQKFKLTYEEDINQIQIDSSSINSNSNNNLLMKTKDNNIENKKNEIVLNSSKKIEKDKPLEKKENNSNNKDKNDIQTINIIDEVEHQVDNNNNNNIIPNTNSKKKNIYIEDYGILKEKETKNPISFTNNINKDKKEPKLDKGTTTNNNNTNNNNPNNELKNEDNYTLEQLVYENLRLNKSFSYENNKGIEQFDDEYMCRSLSLALMILIENSYDKHHLTDLAENQIFIFFNPIYNENFDILLNFFSKEHNKNFNSVPQLSNLDNLELKLSEIINEEISITKHLKNNKNEKFIKDEGFNGINDGNNINGINIGGKQENFRFKNGLGGDIEQEIQDIRFIDEYFALKRKRPINYAHVSEISKNIMCKELSCIGEIDSELNKTNSNDNISNINYQNNPNNTNSNTNGNYSENLDTINGYNANNTIVSTSKKGEGENEFKDKDIIDIINTEEGKEINNNNSEELKSNDGFDGNNNNLISNVNDGNNNNNLNLLDNITEKNDNKDKNKNNEKNKENNKKEDNKENKDKKIEKTDSEKKEHLQTNEEENIDIKDNLDNNKQIFYNDNDNEIIVIQQEDEQNKNKIIIPNNKTNFNINVNTKKTTSSQKNNNLPSEEEAIVIPKMEGLQRNMMRQMNSNNGMISPIRDYLLENDENEVTETDYIIDVDCIEKFIVFLMKQAEVFDEDFNYFATYIPQRKYVPPPDPQAIFDFCADLIILTYMTKEVIIIALIYIERFIFNTGILLTSRNWRRLLFISLVVASKIWDDHSFENVQFIKAFPYLKVGEMNSLERVFLELINYRVYISQSEYFRYFLIMKSLALNYNYNGRQIVPIPFIKSVKSQEYSNQMQKRMRKKVTLNNSAQF